MFRKINSLAGIFMGSIIGLVLIAFIGTIFFSWGMGADGQQMNIAGEINGKKIPLEYYDSRLQQARNELQQRYNGEVPEYESRNLPKRVWDNIVSEELFNDILKDMEISASREQVLHHFTQNILPGFDTASIFQTNGSFDTVKYVAYLTNPATYNNTPGLRQFALHTERLIVPLSTLENLMLQGVSVSPSEVKRYYHEQRDSVVFEYAQAKAADFQIDSATITEQMVQRYYQTHPDSFRVPDQASLYFVKIPKVVSAYDSTIYKEELQQLKNRIEEEGLSFADEAMYASDDPGSAENGGSLGWFGRGRMVPVFEEVAFALDSGEISDPVLSQFGYHLIQSHGTKVENGDTLVLANHILRKIVPTNETLDSLESLTNTLLDTLLAGTDITKISEIDSHVHVDSTGYFDQNTPYINGLGYLNGPVAFAMNSSIGTVSETFYQDDQAFYLLEVHKKRSEGLAPMQEVASEIRTQLIDSMSLAQAKAYLESKMQNLPSADANASLVEYFSSDSLIQAAITDTITRTGYVPSLGSRNAAIAAAFVQPLNVISRPIRVAKSYVLVKPVFRQQAQDISAESPVYSQTRSALLSRKAQQEYIEWFEQYRKKADIESYYGRYYL